MQAVIFAGGMGTRLREETEWRPKPLVEIGGKPILWHLMKNLSSQGINEFVICLGYRGEQIKDYFLNYKFLNNDFMVQIDSNGSKVTLMEESDSDSWSVTLVDTGLNSMTGGRLNRVKKYLRDEPFLCTYGDGLANVNISSLTDFHTSHGKTATVTAVKPTTRFGALQINPEGSVTKFAEKPKSDKWVNGGFFIFEQEIFNYLDDNSILEEKPLESLASEGHLMAFKHEGFWQPMDTYRESSELNVLWSNGQAPWKNWR